MSKRVVYHVTPEGEEWKVKREGAERAAGILENKQDAVDRAVELAKNAPLGQVKVHGRDGEIQYERTYGEDPRKYPG